MSNLSEIPKDRKVFLLDHIGVRSAVLADELEKQGYTQLAVIEGGLDRWIAFNCDITVFASLRQVSPAVQAMAEKEAQELIAASNRAAQ